MSDQPMPRTIGRVGITLSCDAREFAAAFKRAVQDHAALTRAARDGECFAAAFKAVEPCLAAFARAAETAGAQIQGHLNAVLPLSMADVHRLRPQARRLLPGPRAPEATGASGA